MWYLRYVPNNAMDFPAQDVPSKNSNGVNETVSTWYYFSKYVPTDGQADRQRTDGLTVQPYGGRLKTQSIFVSQTARTVYTIYIYFIQGCASDGRRGGGYVGLLTYGRSLSVGRGRRDVRSFSCGHWRWKWPERKMHPR